MRISIVHCTLITLLILAIASPSPVYAAKKMLMQATFNPTQTEQGVSVSISGRVFDTTNASISNAIISIQVNNPQGTSTHIAQAITNQNGSFEDEFFFPSDSPGGNYTAFLVADKPGYDTVRVTLIFAYSSPDFTLMSSKSTLTVRQGQTGSSSVTVLGLRGFHELVNLTALELPSGIALRFNPTSTAPGGTSNADVSVSSFASPGNYTITVLGVSGSVTHKVFIQLIVSPGPIQAVYFLAFSIAVVAIGLLLFLRRSGNRKRRVAAVEELLKQTSADKGYVATARVIARLEELRAMSAMDEPTYQRLRKEYEKRLEKSK